MRCEEISFENVLLELDEESAAFRAAALHLETCPHCRQKLADLSAVDDLTEEACETLRTRGEATLDLSNGGKSFAVSTERLLTDDEELDCESIPLDFLESARHPEMLGRLGRYDVERVIGAGGMGIVLKGFDTELHRVVAIKALLPHLATSSAARRRFAREAQAAAAVVHEHVIPIYNVESDANVPYLVMQFVPGHSLQARVDEKGPLGIKEVLRIARQAAAGLAAAHAQGVIHRDVKPANILLEDSIDRVLLSDFGLARMADDATLTRSGILTGTPHYMSPEQASGLPLDCRSDLFSLGGVIYFMCTGHPPYRAESSMAVLNRICHEPHRPVDAINAEVPLEVADLIDRLLAKDPSRRFTTASEVEAHCSALLAVLQQGRRLRRRRVFGAPRLTRMQWITAAIGLALCGSIGLGIARFRNGAHSQLKFQAPLSPPESMTQVPRIEIPRDTFDNDLADLQSRIDSLAAPDLTGSASLDQGREDWDSAIVGLERQLRELGQEQTEPSGASLSSESQNPQISP